VTLPGAYAPTSIAPGIIRELTSLPTRNIFFDKVVVLGEVKVKGKVVPVL
jgi:hypothetical protein